MSNMTLREQQRERERARIHAQEAERFAAQQRFQQAMSRGIAGVLAFLIVLPFVLFAWFVRRTWRGFSAAAQDLRDAREDIKVGRLRLAAVPTDAAASSHAERARAIASELAYAGRRKIELEGELMSVEAQLRDAAHASQHPELVARRTAIISELAAIDDQSRTLKTTAAEPLPGGDVDPAELRASLAAAQRLQTLAAVRMTAWAALPLALAAVAYHAASQTPPAVNASQQAAAAVTPPAATAGTEADLHVPAHDSAESVPAATQEGTDDGVQTAELEHRRAVLLFSTASGASTSVFSWHPISAITVRVAAVSEASGRVHVALDAGGRSAGIEPPGGWTPGPASRTEILANSRSDGTALVRFEDIASDETEGRVLVVELRWDDARAVVTRARAWEGTSAAYWRDLAPAWTLMRRRPQRSD